MSYGTSELSAKEKAAFRFTVFAFGILVGWLFYDEAVIGLLVGISMLPLEGEYKKNVVERRKNTLLLQFKDLLYSMSASVSTGRSIGQALEESLEFCLGTYEKDDYIICELEEMIKKIEQSNVSDIDALKDFAYRSDLEDIRDFVTVCETCKRLGGDFTRALDKSADIIGDKITLEKELKTVMAQKKLESRIVALSPFALIFAVKILSPSYLEPLSVTLTGKVIASVALAMIIAGWLCIERVNRIEV